MYLGYLLIHGFAASLSMSRRRWSELCLPNDSSDKLEVTKVVSIADISNDLRRDPHSRCFVWLIRLLIRCTWFKQCYLSICVTSGKTYRSWDQRSAIPLPCNTARIHPVLVVELDTQFPVLDLVSRPPLKRMERVFKDVLSSDIEVKGGRGDRLISFPLEFL
jgi:hypothetical protein